MFAAGQLVAAVCQHELHDALDGRIEGVIKHDMAADIEYLVDVEEVDQRVIEGVPSVDEAALAEETSGQDEVATF